MAPLLAAFAVPCYATPVTSERARMKRMSWQGGVAANFEQMDEVDLSWWLAQSPADRLRAMWSIVEDSLALQGQNGAAPRLQRSIGGVRPLRG